MNLLILAQNLLTQIFIRNYPTLLSETHSGHTPHLPPNIPSQSQTFTVITTHLPCIHKQIHIDLLVHMLASILCIFSHTHSYCTHSIHRYIGSMHTQSHIDLIYAQLYTKPHTDPTYNYMQVLCTLSHAQIPCTFSYTHLLSTLSYTQVPCTLSHTLSLHRKLLHT